jgi:hypothetical protein
MALVKVSWLASLMLLISPAIYARDAKPALSPVPASQQAALTRRLKTYTEAFRTKNWGALYDLVSDQNKRRNDGTILDREIFVRDMQYPNSARLEKFTPVRAAVTTAFVTAFADIDIPITPVRKADRNRFGSFVIYGCGEIAHGDDGPERRMAAVIALLDSGVWSFTKWTYTDSFEGCSQLSDPAWNPDHFLRLDGPMDELFCEVYTCEL